MFDFRAQNKFWKFIRKILDIFKIGKMTRSQIGSSLQVVNSDNASSLFLINTEKLMFLYVEIYLIFDVQIIPMLAKHDILNLQTYL